jgi:4-hydroxyphenylpyruvate dioxygenase
MYELGQPLQPELPITDFDAIEFYVGNAKQAAYYYRHALGFDVVGYRGPETGCREQASYYLRQGNVEFVLSAGLTQDSPIVQHVKRHGDGVREIRFKCTNVIEAFNTALERGATPVYAPKALEDKDGVVHKAAIQTYGDTIHVFVDRRDYQGVFEPGYEACQSSFGKTPPVGLNRVDHIVGNVYAGALDRWVDFYRNVFGFRVLCEFSEDDIKTDNTALASKVVANQSLSIRMPINVPAEGKGRSQIKEYLDYYHSEGAQHIAIACDDVVSSVRQMRENGLGFIYVPQTYFEASKARIGSPEELVAAQSWEDLAEQGILVDAEREGYLLQLFTQPQEDLPTFFFEFIQRVGGAVGFGHGNFQALFEAIEREQALRGNL